MEEGHLDWDRQREDAGFFGNYLISPSKTIMDGFLKAKGKKAISQKRGRKEGNPPKALREEEGTNGARNAENRISSLLLENMPMQKIIEREEGSWTAPLVFL
jgi:hypothetical protein